MNIERESAKVTKSAKADIDMDFPSPGEPLSSFRSSSPPSPHIGEVNLRFKESDQLTFHAFDGELNIKMFAPVLDLSHLQTFADEFLDTLMANGIPESTIGDLTDMVRARINSESALRHLLKLLVV